MIIIFGRQILYFVQFPTYYSNIRPLKARACFHKLPNSYQVCMILLFAMIEQNYPFFYFGAHPDSMPPLGHVGTTESFRLGQCGVPNVGPTEAGNSWVQR